jgi:hypothetical protein
MSLGFRVRQCPAPLQTESREELVAQSLLVFIVFRSHNRQDRS